MAKKLTFWARITGRCRFFSFTFSLFTLDRSARPAGRPAARPAARPAGQQHLPGKASPELGKLGFAGIGPMLRVGYDVEALVAVARKNRNLIPP